VGHGSTRFFVCSRPGGSRGGLSEWGERGGAGGTEQKKKEKENKRKKKEKETVSEGKKRREEGERVIERNSKYLMWQVWQLHLAMRPNLESVLDKCARKSQRRFT
jgi:hypothetical protein